MERLDIYNMALDSINIEPLTKEQLSAGTDPVVKTLNRFFGTAIRKASREHNWSFLTERIVLEGNDLGAMKGYQHSYKLPDDLFRLCYAEGGAYERVGSLLLTDGEPEIYAIRIDSDRKNNYYFGDDELIPEDFWELVSYALAFYSSQKLGMDDNSKKMLVTIYNSILQGMVDNDIKHEVRLVTRADDAFEETLL